MIAVVMAKNIITMEPMAPAAMAVAVENHGLVADADKDFVVIIKGGKIYKKAIK